MSGAEVAGGAAGRDVVLLTPQGAPGDLRRREHETVRDVEVADRPRLQLRRGHCRPDGRTVEITRLCVLEGYANAASMLLGACRRAAWALGYTRIVTMTLKAEGGASLRGAGYTLVGERPDAHWNRPGRPRVETLTGEKFKWEDTAPPRLDSQPRRAESPP